MVSPSPSDSHRLAGIESLRWVAAAMIVVYHTVEMTKLPIPSELNVIKTHFGMGVPLFYALSGFVLSFGYLDGLGGRDQIRSFYLRRYFRIAPLFYLMLGVWMAYSRFKSPAYAVGPFEFLLNVAFLFGLVPGREDSLVAAGWSIGVEMLFYLVFPVVAAVVATPMAGAIAFVVFVVVSSLTFNRLQSLDIGFYAYGNLLTHLPFFLSGVLAYLIWKKEGFRVRRVAGASLLAGVALASWMLVYWPAAYVVLSSYHVVDLVRTAWALVFGALILATCYWPNPVSTNRVTRYLGTISFSLYLLHPLVIAISMDEQRRIANALGNGFLALGARVLFVFTVVIGLATLTFRFVEKPGMALGKRLTARSRAASVGPIPNSATRDLHGS
jgi:peptidoglycan/LPS O-acetylase OafA/YrhL